MKNLFFAFGLLLAFSASAQTINLTPTSLEVITASSTARTFYELDDVYLTYKSGKVEVFSADTKTKLFSGDTSGVIISGLTTWSSKVTKLVYWFQDATSTSGLRTFLPRRELNVRYRTSTSILTAYNDDSKQVLWEGSIDSIKITGVTGASNKLAYFRGKYYFDRLRDQVDMGEPATIAAGAAAGASPTIAIVAKSNCGRITLTTGASPTTTGILATVTLPVTYPTGTIINLTAGDLNSAVAITKVFTTGAAGSFTLNASGSALTGATAYTWDYCATGF